MNKKNKDLYWFHSYKVVQNVSELTPSHFPTVNMEISEQATIEDHLYAFERFLQGIGFVLPDNSHLDFVETEPESRDKDDMIVIEGDHKNNGVN